MIQRRPGASPAHGEALSSLQSVSVTLELPEFSTRYLPCMNIPACHNSHSGLETYPGGLWSPDVVSPLHACRGRLLGESSMQRMPLAPRMSHSRTMDIMTKSTLLPATARRACGRARNAVQSPRLSMQEPALPRIPTIPRAN